MQAPISTSIKLRLHDALVEAVMAGNVDRHGLARATREPWSRERFSRLLQGPEQHSISLDKLAGLVGALGRDVEIDVRIRPRHRVLPQRHVGSIAA